MECLCGEVAMVERKVEVEDPFLEAFSRTMLFEGERKYTNLPFDPGGQTYSGISRVYWPSWAGWNFLDKGLRDEADILVPEFYRINFWNRIQGDVVCKLSPAIAYEIFDTSVHTSVHTGCTFLQQALNLLNRNQKEYKDILDDGMLGLITLTTLSLSFVNNPEARILKVMNHLQGAFYIDRMTKHPEREEFVGWFDRA